MSTHNVNSALSLLKVLADEMDRDSNISLPLVFLRVAQAGSAGVDQGQLQTELKMGSSSISRAIQSLGKVHYLKAREGLDLVERAFDPSDNRRRTLKLTPKGERFVTKLFK